MTTTTRKMITRTAIRAALTCPPSGSSGSAAAERQLNGVYDGGRAVDLQHVDHRVGGDDDVVVVRRCRPLLATDADSAAATGRDRGERPAAPADQRRRPGPQRRHVAVTGRDRAYQPQAGERDHREGDALRGTRAAQGGDE